MSSLLVGATISFAFAQENTAATSSTNNYKHDVGFNTSFILNGIINAENNALSLIYKSYSSDRTAWRFGVDGIFYSNKNSREASTGVSSTYTKEHSNTQVSVTFGREFQRPVTTKWTWYFGGDLVPFYRNITLEEVQTFSETIDRREDSEYGIRFRSFLGVRFNINDRLYLSIEPSFSISYAREEYNRTVTEPQSVISTLKTKGNSIGFSASSASGVFFNYRF